MVSQSRTEKGRFGSKSQENRSVRTIRLTDSTWQKLGLIAKEKGITRADLIEEWARQDFSGQTGQLELFTVDQELITKDTRKTGTELAHRLRLSSGALTNWFRENRVPEKTKEHDPDGIPWEREPGGRRYRPIL